MITKKDALKVIHAHTEELELFGVKRIGIFGSLGRLSFHKKSDIDVLVEFKQGEKAFDNYMELKFLLEKLFQRKVDLVIKGALKPSIKQYILKDVIYA